MALLINPNNAAGKKIEDITMVSRLLYEEKLEKVEITQG